MKKSIGLRFSRAKETYDKEAVVQRKAAVDLVSIHNDFYGTGLDLGCGTGFLYDVLQYPYLIGIDISEEMIKAYRKKNSKAFVADIENLPFKNGIFDFAISNFSLHWTDFKKATYEVYRVLKKDGLFLFNIPVKNSFKIIEDTLGFETFSFLSYSQVLKITEENFKIEKSFIKSYEMYFNSGLDMLKHLKNTGTTYYKNGKSIGKKLKIYKKFKSLEEGIFLNFDVAFIKAYRK